MVIICAFLGQGITPTLNFQVAVGTIFKGFIYDGGLGMGFKLTISLIST